jgi:ribosome-associated protein
MKKELSQLEPNAEEAIIETNDFARICVRAASEMKAEELVVLDVKELTSYCDYFVICTGTNARQVRAIAQRVLDIFKKRGSPPKAEGMKAGRWVLVDLGDVLLHVFDGPMRGYYDLDALWIDAPRVPLNELGLDEDLSPQLDERAS